MVIGTQVWKGSTLRAEAAGPRAVDLSGTWAIDGQPVVTLRQSGGNISGAQG